MNITKAARRSSELSCDHAAQAVEHVLQQAEDEVADAERHDEVADDPVVPPQMAMAPRWPYLPTARVTSAMTTMRSTTRPPLSFSARLQLDELVGDEDEAERDGGEGRVAARPSTATETTAQEDQPVARRAQRQPEDEQRRDDHGDQVAR